MPLIGAVVLFIQLCFAYHALKTGRAYWWLFWSTLLASPRKFHAAMELSILGYHFRRIANRL